MEKIVMHEVSPTHHRIVLMSDKGPDAGDWEEQHSLATKGKYIANMDASLPLPCGVFTVTEVQYTILD